jgi:hypothetical protein
MSEYLDALDARRAAETEWNATHPHVVAVWMGEEHGWRGATGEDDMTFGVEYGTARTEVRLAMPLAEATPADVWGAAGFDPGHPDFKTGTQVQADDGTSLCFTVTMDVSEEAQHPDAFMRWHVCAVVEDDNEHAG